MRLLEAMLGRLLLRSRARRVERLIDSGNFDAEAHALTRAGMYCVLRTARDRGLPDVLVAAHVAVACYGIVLVGGADVDEFDRIVTVGNANLKRSKEAHERRQGQEGALPRCDQPTIEHPPEKCALPRGHAGPHSSGPY